MLKIVTFVVLGLVISTAIGGRLSEKERVAQWRKKSMVIVDFINTLNNR
jgi:hypothetical protein